MFSCGFFVFNIPVFESTKGFNSLIVNRKGQNMIKTLSTNFFSEFTPIKEMTVRSAKKIASKTDELLKNVQLKPQPIKDCFQKNIPELYY